MAGADSTLFAVMLENALLKHKAQVFEDFFVQCAITLWGTDFVPWRPQGPIIGDLKCDGYRNSEKAVFQSYAPEKYDASKFASKITADFNGARLNFGDKMQKWVFVHNQKGGLPAEPGMLVLDLSQQYPDIIIETWTPDHLIQQLLKLPETDLGTLFPSLVKGQDFTDATWKFMEEVVKEKNAGAPGIGVVSQSLPNQLSLDGAIDSLNEVDREVRLRVLGYCRWYEPATKSEVFEKLALLGHGQEIVENNAQRLQGAELIQITENHYLTVNKDICQQAADFLMDEFLQELEE